jgi:hypothetical protein
VKGDAGSHTSWNATGARWKSSLQPEGSEGSGGVIAGATRLEARAACRCGGGTYILDVKKNFMCLGGRGRLPARGSRSPVRAYINAYGSSSHGFAARRQAEWITTAAGNGYCWSRRLKRSHVIPRSRFRRDNQRRQVRTNHRRNADRHWLLPVIP